MLRIGEVRTLLLLLWGTPGDLGAGGGAHVRSSHRRRPLKRLGSRPWALRLSVHVHLQQRTGLICSGSCGPRDGTQPRREKAHFQAGCHRLRDRIFQGSCKELAV